MVGNFFLACGILLFCRPLVENNVLKNIIMDFLLSLIIWGLCGFGCYKIAENNGRDTTLAAVLGVIFGVFAILGYAIAGKKK